MHSEALNLEKKHRYDVSSLAELQKVAKIHKVQNVQRCKKM